MKKIAYLVLFLSSTIITEAQILKVDKGEINSDSSNYFLGGINLDFNVNNRSTTADKEVTFIGLNGRADLVYLSENTAYILLNNINYFKSTGGALISTGYTHFRINFLRKNNLSYEGFSQIQYDDGRRMPLRRLAGGGIRFNILNTKNSEFHVGTGAIYEYEEWRSLDTEELITKEIWKSSTYMGFKSNLNENINFHGIFYFQSGLDQQSDLFRNRYSGDLSISFDITKNLAFTTTFVAQYEDKPIISINRWVYSLTNGLKWNF